MIDRVDTQQAPQGVVHAVLVAGSIVRVAYGVGALLAPQRMVAAGFAPDTHGLPDPRLTLRAFGGHLLVTGCMTLAAVRARRDVREAAALSMLIDAFDVVSTVLEQRARGGPDATITGGYRLSGTGATTFALALAGLRGRD